MSSTGEQNVLSRKKGVVIRQSNDIIEARYNFSLWEMRIFKTMLTRISAGDESFEQEVILIRELLAKYEMSDGGKAYELVNEAAKSVKSRFVHIPYFDERNNRRLKIMPLFTLIDIPTEHADENSYIKLRFNDELKPYLIKLQSRYTSIDEKILAGMDSAYTMRIYELVKENEYKGQGEFGFDEFREIIGAKEYNEDQEVIRDVIRSWQDVKRAILIPSQKHINEHTDITFNFDKVLAEKTGPGRRKVAGVKFYDIKSKIDKNEIQPLDISNPQKFQDESNELLALVAEFGITRGTITAWLEKYGKQQVYNGVAYSLGKNKAGKIKNMAAYIYKMVATSDLQTAAAAKDKAEKITKKKSEEEQTQIEFEKTLDEKITQIKADFYKVKKQLVKTLVETEDKLHNELLATLKATGQNTRNPITLMALKGYQAEPNLNAKEEFLKNFEENSNFAGFVVNQVQKVRPQNYWKTLNDYRKKVVAAGFDENIIS
jgi:plasmid replication initiation protein